MAATQSRGQRRTQTAYHGTTVYVQGNVVRKTNALPNAGEPARKQLSRTTRKNRDKARHMNVGYVLYLTAALAVVTYLLIGYIGIQSDITNSMKNIARMEAQLNNLKLSNDETYSRITSSIDLEEIKRVAIQELGMTYAKEGQIVQFSGESSDYVRQFTDIVE